MTLERVAHQKLGRPRRVEDGEGEAQAVAIRDETRSAGHQLEGSGREDLLQQALSRENMVAAWKHVKANKGSAGVDGLTIEQTIEYLKTHWSRIRAELLSETYRPQAVRRVEIPKPGGGTRELGIATVTDRLTQQALLQVLQPLIDPTIASLRDPAVRQLAMLAAGLSPDALQAITQIVDHARRIEGLDGVRNGASASNGPRPAFYPRRRGRRARVRARETPTPDTPPAPEAF